jgi:hypothetical protein
MILICEVILYVHSQVCRHGEYLTAGTRVGDTNMSNVIETDLALYGYEVLTFDGTPGRTVPCD